MPVHLLAGDESAIVGILPNREPGAGSAPSLHHFFVRPLAVCEPLKKIEDQSFDYGILGGISSGSHYEFHFISLGLGPTFPRLKYGVDFGIERQVRLRKAIDAISLGGALRDGRLQREMKEPADVIILVEDAEDALGFFDGEPESDQS